MKKLNKKVLAVLLTALMAASAMMMTGCGGGEATADKETLIVYNWGDYIDPDVLDMFEEENNVEVVYEEYATNEDMYVKVLAGASDYDIAIPSDYMIYKMIHEDLLLPINMGNIPNYSLIADKYKNLEFDPNNEYSVPYMWGTLGIVYNKTMVSAPITSWSALWDEQYAGNMYMLNSVRDSMAVAEIMLGYSINTTDPDEIEAAKNLLIEQKPLVTAYVGDESKDLMIAGNAAMALVWSGDAPTMMSENPDLDYIIPEENGNQFVDSMVIPKTSKHPELAEKFIDFMCRPDIAAMNAEYIGYSTPIDDAKAMLPEELTSNPNLYPDAETLSRCEVFVDLGDAQPLYDRAWTEMLAN